MTLRWGRASYIAALLWASGCGARSGELATPAVGVSEPPSPAVTEASEPRPPAAQVTTPSTEDSVALPASSGAPSPASEEDPPGDLPTWSAAGTVADLPATADRFVPVPLPAGPEIVSVAGRSRRDVWLLNDANDVYRYDGRAARPAYWGICLEEPYQPGQLSLHRALMRRIAPMRESVLAIGASPGANEIFRVQARLGPGRNVECVTESGDPRAFDHSPTTAWLFVAAPGLPAAGALVVLAGQSAPVPAIRSWYGSREPSTAVHNLWMRSPLDVWAAGLRIWQYQGLGWQDRGPAPFEVLDLWSDERGTGWIIGKPGTEPPSAPGLGISLYDRSEQDHSVGAAPAAVVARFDGHRWQPLPVPEGFTATRVHGTAPDDVWFVGGPRAYHFDGQTLRQTAMPLDGVLDIRVVGGDLWVVGYRSEAWSRRAPNTRQVVTQGERRGAAVRLARAATEGQR